MSVHNIWGVFNLQREKSSPVTSTATLNIWNTMCVHFVRLQYMIIIKTAKNTWCMQSIKIYTSSTWCMFLFHNHNTFSITILIIGYIDAKNKLLQKGKKLHQPGIEPGVGRWQRPMLPLHHWCGNRAGRKWLLTSFVPTCYK